MAEDDRYLYRSGGTLLTTAEVEALRKKPETELSELERHVLKDIEAAKTMRRIMDGTEYSLFKDYIRNR